MLWQQYFEATSEPTEEYARWLAKLYEKLHPALTEMSWKPCLCVLDGFPVRSGVLVTGAAPRGLPER